MAQVLIRNLKESVIERYRAMAALKGSSLESELRSLIERGIELDAEGKRALSQAVRDATRNPADAPESWVFIREDRVTR